VRRSMFPHSVSLCSPANRPSTFQRRRLSRFPFLLEAVHGQPRPSFHSSRHVSDRPLPFLCHRTQKASCRNLEDDPKNRILTYHIFMGSNAGQSRERLQPRTRIGSRSQPEVLAVLSTGTDGPGCNLKAEKTCPACSYPGLTALATFPRPVGMIYGTLPLCSLPGGPASTVLSSPLLRGQGYLRLLTGQTSTVMSACKQVDGLLLFLYSRRICCNPITIYLPL
jgi:hypothetical protein